MDAPTIDNRTNFVVEPHIVLDKDGEKLVTMVKATFEQDEAGVLRVAELQRPVRFADEPWGDPATTPPKYPCDVCVFKPATDVVIVAKGHAPEGKPVEAFDVAVQVGALRKSLRVFGLRVWLDGGVGLSEPRALSEEELRYDYAWGGIDISDPADIAEEARNPVGRGVAREASALTHQRAPSIEDPAALISSASTRPAPAGIGALGPHWMPRRSFTGTYDEAWHREQAPLFPADRDDRANQCASPDLMASPPLVGGEEVALLNVTPGGGLLQFLLPQPRPTIELHIRGRQPVTFTPHLDTVLIDTLEPIAPSRVVVEMVWRATTPAPRRMKDTHLVVKA